jgi:hypothetical protein
VAAFFIFEALFQLYWIQKLFLASSSKPRQKYDFKTILPKWMGGIDKPRTSNVDRLLEELEKERAQNPNEPDDTQMVYVPIYTLVNICTSAPIATVSLFYLLLMRLTVAWILAFLQSRFKIALVCTITAFIIIFYTVVYVLVYHSEFRLSRRNWTTHVVAKTIAGAILVVCFLNVAIFRTVS